ncbi:PTS system, ascorbate-specific IIB component [Thermanaeromonas toyohensis ToBE]|uniref:PTS system, ascorbate-specific IIB component n=1 Tax=Thermanaeromonas toyohensis ToBE TaxID=698762 RepID=A0A1W1VMI2_9FIRM|nr:PTS sugar transporter subunit IIB [Thermanaeromonas toyohensis]SMB94493.1 PTS system, ascorbate-specific IIB component [Thermanaeromonas toyohensis ToBE]
MKILAVCGMGLGSSLILRLGIEGALRDLGIEGEVEVADIGTAKSVPCDLIVTSEQLAELLTATGKPIVVIHNYLDKEEMREKLEAALKGKG